MSHPFRNGLLLFFCVLQGVLTTPLYANCDDLKDGGGYCYGPAQWSVAQLGRDMRADSPGAVCGSFEYGNIDEGVFDVAVNGLIGACGRKWRDYEGEPLRFGYLSMSAQCASPLAHLVLSGSRQACCRTECQDTKQISLSGPGVTNALPAGPSLALQVRVKGGSPGRTSVSIRSLSGGLSIGGITNDDGIFDFSFIPPSEPGLVELRADCSVCDNTASKSIQVQPAPPPPVGAD